MAKAPAPLAPTPLSEQMNLHAAAAMPGTTMARYWQLVIEHVYKVRELNII